MKANINDLKVVREIPRYYNGTDGYHRKTEAHHEDGWRNVVKPKITSAQRLGETYYDEENNVVTYNIIDKSELEIENELRRSIRASYQNSHEIEGNKTYQDFRVDLLIAQRKGDIDRVKLFQIEDLLEPIYSRVRNGNWDSAFVKIEQTSINPDSIIEDWRQKAITKIDNYIKNNY